jgi:hypothetical protein
MTHLVNLPHVPAGPSQGSVSLFLCVLGVFLGFVLYKTWHRRTHHKRVAERWPHFADWKHNNEWSGKRLVAYGGKLGAGKTHSAVEKALRWCEDREKVLVTNADINIEAVEWYAHKHKMPFVERMARTGQIFQSKDIKTLLGYKRAVVLLDEAGIFVAGKVMQGRGYKDFQGLIADLLLLRKSNSDLIWVCQVFADVAHEIRGVTEMFYHCIGVFGRYKVVAGYDAYGYERFLVAPTFRNWFKLSLEIKIEKFNQDVFICYQTLERLDGKIVFDPRDSLVWSGIDSHQELAELVPVWIPSKGEYEMWPELAPLRVVRQRKQKNLDEDLELVDGRIPFDNKGRVAGLISK